MNRQTWILLQAATIIAAAFWIFQPALHGDWLSDDHMYLVQNTLLSDPARVWKAWFEPASFIEYYPLQETLQWVQWQLWHNDTLGYHLTNVALHAANALLVWRLLAKLGLRLAWLGGMLFTVHPLMVESVAWISEFKNTLSLFPFLLAMCSWIDYENRGRRRDYLLALGFFLAAMLCKITMAPFPAVILLYAWWKRGRIGWGDLRAVVPFALVSLVLGYTTIWAGSRFLELHHLPPDVVHLGGLASRLAVAGLSLSFYFAKFFWPLDPIPIYPLWPVDPPSPWQFLPWPVFIGLAVFLWRRRAGWGRHVLLGLGFFVVNLVPFIGVIAVSYMKFTWVMDHLLYIPMIGLIGLVVAGLGRLGEQLPASTRLPGLALGIVVLGGLAWESRTYAAAYQNDLSLCAYTVERNPEAWSAHANLGFCLLQEGRVDEGIAHEEEAIRLNHDYAEPHNNLGVAFFDKGLYPQALEQYEIALKIKPSYAEAYSNIGNLLGRQGRTEEAVAHYEKAIQLDPSYAQAYYNLGNVLLQTKRIPEAIAQYEETLKIDPSCAPAHGNMGVALYQLHRNEEAIRHFQQALVLYPGYIEAHNNLGYALSQEGRFPEAIDQFAAAIELNPDSPAAHHNLANVLLQVHRVPEAIEQFETALRLNPNDANAREQLNRLHVPASGPSK